MNEKQAKELIDVLKDINKTLKNLKDWGAIPVKLQGSTQAWKDSIYQSESEVPF